MALKFTMTSQVNASQGVKCLVYANSGLGKTLMCATAPGPIVISAESGLLVLNKKNIEKIWGVATPGITYDIPVIEVSTVQDVTEAHKWLQTPAASWVQTVCVDSISEIGETVLNNAKPQVKDPRQAYGMLIEQMENVVRAFRDLPGKHVYMTAKLEAMKDEITGVTSYGPSMPGSKLGPKLPYFFDEMFRLDVNKDLQGNSFRFLQTAADLRTLAKDRSGALDIMEPPNLTHVFNKILTGA